MTPDVTPPLKSNRTSLLKLKAINLGFDLVGIAQATTLDNETELLSQWLNSGNHGVMSYLERNQDKRRDVSLIVPGARSVIVVAENYYTPFEHHETPDTGKVSRYAWGDDYHEVVTPRLKLLAQYIEDIVPEAESRSYVDTGPVMEKQWAIRAGIGWQGKHTNIISRELGSFFFLGVIITTAEFEYDSPIADHCGSCTACIEACPTSAIEQPNFLNATKCLSYWTIETKPDQSFPEEIATHVDGWIYGCDICQDVCPWNRFKKDSDNASYEPRQGETEFLIDEVLGSTREEFSARFKNSPVKRTKFGGLQRNARELQTYYAGQSPAVVEKV